jgi:hypothetical protein
MIIPIPVQSKDYHRAILLTLNPMLNFTKYEQDIIVTMVTYNLQVLEKETRKKIVEILDTDQFTFNNYIQRLKKSGVLIKTVSGLELNTNLKNILADKEVSIKLIRQ